MERLRQSLAQNKNPRRARIGETRSHGTARKATERKSRATPRDDDAKTSCDDPAPRDDSRPACRETGDVQVTSIKFTGANAVQAG